MISSCQNYLHADVSDGEDLSRHQHEVTDGQLVTISLITINLVPLEIIHDLPIGFPINNIIFLSLVPGTVDSNVTSECHLCCPPPLPTREVSSLDSS